MPPCRGTRGCSAHASLIPELEEVIRRGSPERRAKTLRRITTLFLDGASQFNDDHLGLFDLVFSRLIAGARSRRAPNCRTGWRRSRTAPAEVVRRLAHDDDIAVAGPMLAQSRQLAETDLVDHRPDPRARRICSPLQARPNRGGGHRRAGPPRRARRRSRGWPTIAARACRNGAFARSSSGPKATASWPRRSGCARTFRRGCSATSCSQATALVRQRLLASATPEMQAEIRRLLAKDLAADGRNKRPAGLRDRAAHDRGAAPRGRMLTEATVVEFANKGQYAETVAALSHRFARCRPRWWID